MANKLILFHLFNDLNHQILSIQFHYPIHFFNRIELFLKCKHQKYI